MRKWKDNEVIKVKHGKFLLAVSLITVGLAGFDFINGKYTIYDIITVPVGVFGIWCFGLGGLYKLSRYVTEKYLHKKDNKFDYFHT